MLNCHDEATNIEITLSLGIHNLHIFHQKNKIKIQNCRLFKTVPERITGHIHIANNDNTEQFFSGKSVHVHNNVLHQMVMVQTVHKQWLKKKKKHI